jgi:5'-methylthioadenosine phosphorylase
MGARRRSGVAEAEIGIIGTTADTCPFDVGEDILVDTPYGFPSAPVRIGDVGGKRVAFLARRGEDGQISPPRIPSRANLWALRELGVRRVLAPVISGALTLDFDVGDMVVCDQYVDRTWGREDTYYDGPGAVLVSSARPFCDDLGEVVLRVGNGLGLPVMGGGTAVVIQGPRYSTAAESVSFRAMGWDLVNMVSYPESHLARELQLCYANISLVTDHDSGIAGVGAVTTKHVARSLAETAGPLRALLVAVIPEVGPQPDDDCSNALAQASL